MADIVQPTIVIAFKGDYVSGSTLRTLSERGIKLYNYYPDLIVGRVKSSSREYDCIFDTKRDPSRWGPCAPKDWVHIPHGYDPEIHVPAEPNRADTLGPGCDAAFIGTYGKRKEEILQRLMTLLPDLNLRIWGRGWAEHCKAPAITKCLQGHPLLGQGYAKTIRSVKVNIALMAGSDGQRDQTTTRTFEIPACGGFMLHERSGELLDFFEEGSEVACFESPEELASKTQYYLQNPEPRVATAVAGHRRCVPAYSYDNRMRQLIEWHQKQ